MPCRLIVNADDFGLTEGINRAVEELHHAGALTSATLMATGPAFAHAAAIAQRTPTLGVGAHIVLVDGTPLSPPATIPTLLGPDGKTFRPTLLDFTQAILRGTIDLGDLAREVTAQLEALQDAGLTPTHLDTHKHTHIFPAVTRTLLQVASRFGIAALRNPFEPPWAMALGHGSRTRRTQMYLLDRAFRSTFLNNLQATPGVTSTEGTVAISTTGHLTRATLAEILAALPSAGTWELVTHPGHLDPALDQGRTRLRATRQIEREALIACVPGTHAQLIHFGGLSPYR